VLNDLDPGLFFNTVTEGEVQLADGNHRRSLAWLDGSQPGSCLFLGFPGQVNTGDIDLVVLGLAFSCMFSLELGPLLGRQEPPTATDRQQTVLGQEEGVVLSQALPFPLDIR